MYADDIAQTNYHLSSRANFIRLTTDRAIGITNQYEKAWKIKTNIDKFLVITAARTKPGALNLKNAAVNYANEGRILGLKITKIGITTHIKERRAKAKTILTKLWFSGCPEEIKHHLYKTLGRPIIEYPPIPLNAISLTSILALQAIQNIAILWIKGIRWPNPRSSIRTLHEQYKLEPLNTRMHRLASNVWDRLEYFEDVNYARIWETWRDWNEHKWWPRSLSPARGEPPSPIFSRTYNLNLNWY